MRPISRSLALRLWVVILLAVGIAGPALAADRIGDILIRPDAFDGREVVVEGKASAVDPRTSRRGNDYFTFRLSDETGTALKVFSWGKPVISPGDRIEVSGRFQRERPVGRYSFANEVEASRIRKLP
jgi:hypothetical protein